MRGMMVGLILMLLAAGTAAGQPSALPAIMPLSEIRPGMRGVGRTVVYGQRIDEFGFEVIDILRSPGSSIGADRLIMFRMTGPMVERTGGTAAGMSGSPLYINGRLIGALSASFAWQSAQRDIALATPIEDMLRVLERRTPRQSARPVYQASRRHTINGRPVERVVVVPETFRSTSLSARLTPGVAFARPSVATFTRGLSPRANRILENLLQPQGYEILQGHGGRGDFVARSVEAGSSVGVQQVRGDIDFGGICTVTARIGNRVLVCGHPWESLGDVQYILTAAEILTVVKTMPRPFKVGNLGQIVGIIDQDRGAAIAGTLGRLPRLFNLRVVVTDQDTGTRTDLGAQIVRRRDMARTLAPLVAMSAVERARNQASGEGTAIVKLTLRAKGLPAPIVRENMFYSTRDVATASVLDIVDAMELAFYNDLRQLEPYDLTVEAVLTRQRLTAAIVDAEVSSREVSPGSTLRVRVVLQPYRGESTVTRTIEVPIPQNFPRGPALLVVRPGGFTDPGVPPEAQLTRALASEPEPWGVATLDAALQLFENVGKNSAIAVRIQPFGLPTTPQDFTRFDVPAGRSTQTGWVIQGTERFPILVR